MRILYVSLLLLLLPTAVFAAPRTYIEFADLIQTLLNAGIGVALTLGIVVYFYGIVTGLPKATGGGDVSPSKGNRRG